MSPHAVGRFLPACVGDDQQVGFHEPPWASTLWSVAAGCKHALRRMPLPRAPWDREERLASARIRAFTLSFAERKPSPYVVAAEQFE